MVASLRDELIGAQEPTLRLVPPHVRTEGDIAIEFAHECGYELFPWQELLLRDGLAINDAGKFVAPDVLELVSRQNGKALATDTEVLTVEHGFMAMGDLVPGLHVYGPDGEPTRIVATSGIMHGHECFRVTMTDGRTVVADAGHLWTVADKRRKRSDMWVTKTTDELAREGVHRGAEWRTVTTNGKSYRTREFRWGLPWQEALQAPEAELPFDPYLLGLWLGNGNSVHAALTCDLGDVDHYVEQVVAAGFVPTVRRGRSAARIGITTESGAGRQSRSCSGKLRALGVLGNKHVPAQYLTAGTRQREALLQGLLDADGHITPAGQVDFISITRDLSEAVLYLARSFGWKATISEGRAMLNGKDCGPKWRVQFTPDSGRGIQPFRMSRKAANVKGATRTGTRSVSVESIEAVESVPVQCIKVDRPDGLFLAGRDLIPTHNSVALEVVILYGLFVANHKTVLYTAHRAETAASIFERVQNAIKRTPSLQHELKADRSGGIRTGNGQWSIRLRNGARAHFRTRSPDTGRGIDAVPLLIVDEVQNYSEDELAALQPITSSARNRQIWYAGSAGGKHSTVMGGLVRDAHDGVPGLVAHLYEASEDDDPKAVSTWLRTNPSAGAVLELETIESEARRFPPSKFWRERLGRGDYPSAAGEEWVIPEPCWKARLDEDSEVDGPVAFVADSTVDLEWSTISVAGRRADGDIHIEVVAHERGTTWLGPRLAELARKHETSGIGVDLKSPSASTVLAGLRDAAVTVPVHEFTAEEIKNAWAWFYTAAKRSPAEAPSVSVPGVWHRGADVLTNALAGASVRRLLDQQTWSRKGESDSSPIISATQAGYLVQLLERSVAVPVPQSGRNLPSVGRLSTPPPVLDPTTFQW